MARILIVDDRPLNRQFLTTLLGYQHHDLFESSDGAEALELARKEHPDLIISDVLMPTMDGYEFVRQLRQEPTIADTPVIFSTAHYLSRESQALAEKCGVKSIIYKPCEPVTVLEIVNGALQHVPAPLPAAKPEEFDRDHIQVLTDQLSYKNEQLRNANEKLTALIELSTELAQERDATELIDRYCVVIREVVGARWTLAALLDRTRERIDHLSTAGLDIHDGAELREALMSPGIFATLLKERQTISLSDVTSRSGPLHVPSPLPRTDSLLVTPLAIRGEIYGWIALGGKLGLDAFSQQDEKLMKALAAKVAVGYENALLLEQTQQQLEQLHQEGAEREKAEAARAETQAQLASIIDSAMDAIVAVDEAQEVKVFNAAAEKMFGCSAIDAIGQPLDRFLPTRTRDLHREHIRSFGETHVTTRAMGALGSVTGINASGKEFPLEASISQVEVGGRKLFTAILRDITERQRAEENLLNSNRRLERALVELQEKTVELTGMTQQLWQASKLATMGELAASVAHELNNPLATVALRAENLLLQLPEDASERRPLEIILAEVDRMAKLVSNLLQFSRRTHRQVSTVDVREELGNSIEFIGYHLRSHKIEIVRELSDEVPLIHADRQQLRQLFLNLLTNASDAMPRGGQLKIRVGQTNLEESPAVEIDFSDTGDGIPTENLAKIWEPFFTTKEEGKGTGLGLAICRRIVEEHSGTIEIQSQIGMGTTVKIVFPATSAEERV